MGEGKPWVFIISIITYALLKHLFGYKLRADRRIRVCCRAEIFLTLQGPTPVGMGSTLDPGLLQLEIILFEMVSFS